jgi:hypothetical protein
MTLIDRISSLQKFGFRIDSDDISGEELAEMLEVLQAFRPGDADLLDRAEMALGYVPVFEDGDVEVREKIRACLERMKAAATRMEMP